jgi:hypothetical protein
MIDLLYTRVIPCDEAKPTSCPSDYYEVTADGMRDLSFKIAWALLGLMVIGTVGFILLFYAFGKASERILKRVSNAKQLPVE